MAEKIVKDSQGLAKELVNDCISRQAAIDATWFEPSYTDPLNVLTEVRDRLKVLPSAQPKSYREGYQAGFKDAQTEHKRGKWEFYEDRSPVWDIAGEKTWARAYECSVCGFVHAAIEDFGIYSFCPNCGADMREVDDERLIYTRNNSRDV